VHALVSCGKDGDTEQDLSWSSKMMGLWGDPMNKGGDLRESIERDHYFGTPLAADSAGRALALAGRFVEMSAVRDDTEWNTG
jgi:hypothetical protein